MSIVFVILLLVGLFLALCVLTAFIWSLILLAKGKYKILARTGAIVCAVLLLPGVLFCGWRATEMIVYPQVSLLSDSFTFHGHLYKIAQYDQYPYREHLHEVALVRMGQNRLNQWLDLVFFPTRLYAQENGDAPRDLWERGLMLEGKYERVD